MDSSDPPTSIEAMASRLPDFQSPGDADLQNILGSFYSKLDLSPPVPPLLTNKAEKQAKKGGPNGGGSKAKSGANAASTKKSAADAAAQAKIDKEFEPPETPLETVADPEPVKKEKVVLSNPQWGEAKPGFNAETPISVDVLLPEEHAIKTKITFELFAKTPKGNELICSSEAHAKDGKATCSIPVYIPAYKDESGNRMQKVGYFFIAKHSEAEPLDSSASPKVVDEMAQRVIESHILQNVTFVTGKSFIRTSEAGDLKALGQAVKDWKGKHPDGKLAVFGHADAVGEELSNKQLSERRAKSVHAYLAKDPKSWEELYSEEKWGLICVQELLKHLGHDPGTLDGQDGPKTQAAVKDFQGKKGLPATGNADATTRQALFTAYFESAGSPGRGAKDFDAIDGKAFTGCSEFNLIENTQGACEANRRVAVLLLKVSKNFPLSYPCKQGAILPCQNQTKLQGARRTAGFKCKFYDGLVVEKKGPVPKLVGKLKWVGLKDQEEIKQYVNLKADKPGQGPERRLEVEMENSSDGTKVYWKVTAGKNNSKRNDPKPGVKSEAKGVLVEFKSGVAEVETEVKGGKASLVLACGLAGGDLYLVEVGTVKGKADTWVSVENWRRLEYEIIQPLSVGENRLTDFTVFNPDKSPGLSKKSKDFLTKALSSAFVEFSESYASVYGFSDLPGNGKPNVLDAGYFKKTNGKKAVAMTLGQLRSILDKKAKHRSDLRTVSMIWCDVLAKMAAWNQSFDNIFSETTLTTTKSVFPRVIDSFGTTSYGDYPISTIEWKATHWYDDSQPDQSGVWKPIASPSDPGYQHRVGGNISGESDIQSHIQFINSNQLKIVFPETKPSFPGKRITKDNTGQFVDKGKVIGLSILLAGVACDTNINGAALHGDIWMNTFVGNADPVGMAGVIAHELGHNMGQAYADNSVDATFGRPPSKPIPGYSFPKGVPEGLVYGEHGHRGTHCAKGVKNRTVSSFQNKAAFEERTCIMFGASDMASSREYSYCEDCANYIRAENLTDIRKSWST